MMQDLEKQFRPIGLLQPRKLSESRCFNKKMNLILNDAQRVNLKNLTFVP